MDAGLLKLLNKEQQTIVKSLAEDKKVLIDNFRKKAQTKVLTYVSLVNEDKLTTLQLSRKIKEACNGLLADDSFTDSFTMSEEDTNHKLLMVWFDLKSMGEAATAPRVRPCPWDVELAKRNLQIALSLGNLEEDAKLKVSPATVHIWCTAFKSISTQIKNLYQNHNGNIAGVRNTLDFEKARAFFANELGFQVLKTCPNILTPNEKSRIESLKLELKRQ